MNARSKCVLALLTPVVIGACGGGGDRGEPLQPPVAANQAPSASIGVSVVDAYSSQDITLDGSGSRDSDGTVLSYQWSQIGGDAVVLADANTIRARFKAPPVDSPVELRFRLVVTDDDGATGSTEISLTVRAADVQFGIEVVGGKQFVVDDDRVRLRRTTSAFQGEHVAPLSVAWSSDLVGGLGSSMDELEVELPAGPHVVQAAADFGELGTVRKSVTVRVLPRRSEPSPFLSAPAPGHSARIPIVIVNYLPTVDGVHLDDSLWATRPWPVPSEWGRTLTLEDVRAYIEASYSRVKFGLEERSKFRGYRDATALPYLGYEVVAVWNFYEPIKRGAPYPGSTIGEYLPDMHDIMAKIPARQYVEELGVKEFWLSAYEGWRDDGILTIPESNMASPVTGDISNSHRIPDDLPIFAKTYAVLVLNYFRTSAEALHVQGHHLEALLSHAALLQDGTSDLFWKQFVGLSNTGAFVRGRCGAVHFPLNARMDYDYGNEQDIVESDCEDWRPDGSGKKSMVGLHTWASVPYAWPTPSVPQKDESQWYVYWMQNMPGAGNKIPYGATTMENWWIFVADWDQAITARKGLHK